ncbi:MAG: DUF4340 domain-containing protein [Clostridia bacterium]|nr:DUF4340 domain-containing protein [Clostridia bacterium]
MEKVPRKKARRPVSKKTVFILLLCACLAAGGAVLLERSISHGTLTPQTNEETLVLARPLEDVRSVTITPKDSAAYTLVQGDGGFALEGRENEKLRDSVIREISLSLGEVPAEAVVLKELKQSQGLTPAAFGLEPAKARVEITYLDGEKKELVLGDAAPGQETPQRYCMLAGDPKLYTIIESDAEVFFHEMEYLLDFSQPSLDSSLLDRIEVSGAVVWTAAYTPSGWQMTAPFPYPLSIQRMDAILSRIDYMGFEAYLGEGETVNLSDYGLDEPEVTVRLAQAATVISGETEEGEQVSFPVAEREYLLQLGRNTDESGLYLMWEGKVYKASEFLLGFWKTLDPKELVLTTPINFQVNNLDQVCLMSGNVSKAYEIRMVESITENNQIAADEYGQTLYDLAVCRAGESEDMDAEAFAGWYTKLAALSGDGKLPEDFTLSGESRGTITLINSHLTRTIDFYPFDALHDALAVDGEALFYVRKDWLDGIVAGAP